MDWNWFFSSLSQSTAAIVGLFGAFIFTKIINNEQKFNENNDKIRDMIDNSNNLIRQLSNRRFKWYNLRINEDALDDMKKSFKEDNVNLDLKSEELYEKFNFSPFDKKEDVLKLIEEKILEYKG
jgi:hypothetical protein